MLDEVSYDAEHSGFYARLRDLANMAGESTHHMSDVCEYIYWANQSNLQLMFELSDEDNNRVLIEHMSTTYEHFLASEELTALPSDQIMQQLSEIASVLKGELKLEDSEALNAYMQRDTMPKFMLYSTHQEALAPLLGAFKSSLIGDPEPASSVFFWFFSYRPEGESSQPVLAVNVTYAEKPGDESTHRNLIFTTEQQQGSDTYISIDSFKDFVDSQRARWGSMIGTDGDIRQRCKADYEAAASGKQGYLDPEQYRIDLNHYYEIDDPVEPKRPA